eukprot:scaffold2526_cov131-Cylindrotheca_fusiformis.AAC.7
MIWLEEFCRLSNAEESTVNAQLGSIELNCCTLHGIINPRMVERVSRLYVLILRVERLLAFRKFNGGAALVSLSLHWRNGSVRDPVVKLCVKFLYLLYGMRNIEQHIKSPLRRLKGKLLCVAFSCWKKRDMSEKSGGIGGTTRPKKSRKLSGDKKQLILQQKKERFNRLLYQATKELTREAKRCRTFLLQKSIRKMKKRSDSDSHEVLQSVKHVPLEEVVQQGIRQLGLLHANPDPEADYRQPKRLHPELKDQVESILTHRRFQAILEEWHRKVTDYRRWAMQLDEWSEYRTQPAKGSRSKKKSNPQTQLRRKSLFFGLDTNSEDGESPYGPGAFMEEVPVERKNRKGQRARRAKAIAIQAKNEGRKYESLNWRKSEEKNKKQEQDKTQPNHSEHPRWAANREGQGDILTFRGSKTNFGHRKENAKQPVEEQHPSWVAKQGQKSGIVEFKGTKITF